MATRDESFAYQMESFRAAMASAAYADIGVPVKSGKPVEVKKAPPKKLADWDTVILPAEIKEQIMATLAQKDNTNKIMVEWGFADVLEKGVGLTMLFDGPPGTGKTLAAEAIATHLGKELKILNTGNLESKWVGECEQLITSAFEEAKAKDQVLLFDEAESMLHDRDRVTFWARGQINHLLTTLERHEGVVIFTTNRVQDLDRALERRISLKLTFPFPDQKARALIWRRMIPSKCPLANDVNLEELAVVELAGGDIKNVVMNAVRDAVYHKATELCLAHFLRAIELEIRSKEHFKKRRQEREQRIAGKHDPISALLSRKGVADEIEKGVGEGEPPAPPSPSDMGGKITKTRERHRQDHHRPFAY